MPEPGISYLLQTNLGSLLFDVGFGSDRNTWMHNAAMLGITLETIDALAISHLHPDHMGGMKAFRKSRVMVPDSLGDADGKKCYLPSEGTADHLTPEIITKPGLLKGGVASTGPLARSLFFFGHTEEQALVLSVKNKGLVVFVGCGHPTLPVILKMVRKLSSKPIYAVVGGLHFPITRSRERITGVEIQMMIGTGLPPWKRLREKDMDETIDSINRANPSFVYLSAHDSCDHALQLFADRLQSKVDVLLAGETYHL